MRLIEKLFGGSHLREHETFLCCGDLQIVCTPLQYRILDGCEAIGASKELERVCLRSRIEVQCDDVAPVACLVQDRKLEERVAGESAHRGRTSVHRFPFSLKETAEPSKRFANVDVDVLSLPGSFPP